MEHDGNIYLAKSLYEFWNCRDFERARSLMAADAEFAMVAPDSRFVGSPGPKSYSQLWIEVFPNGQLQIDNIFGSGSYVIVELTAKGTSASLPERTAATLRATGKAITLNFCDVLEIRNEKIFSIRTYFDSSSLLVHTGAAA
jgi:ketosteroid isomerase-like protein